MGHSDRIVVQGPRPGILPGRCVPTITPPLHAVHQIIVKSFSVHSDLSHAAAGLRLSPEILESMRTRAYVSCSGRPT